MSLNRMNYKVEIALGVVFLLVAGSGYIGYHFGKFHSANPTLIEYYEPELVLRPGDVACPSNDTCTWKAWDLNTDKEVKPDENTGTKP